MAFTEYLMAARVCARSLSFLLLSFFFVFIFGHRSNEKTQKREKERERQKKSGKQGGERDEKGNLRPRRIASKEKKER